jgi:hypothetical protein
VNNLQAQTLQQAIKALGEQGFTVGVVGIRPRRGREADGDGADAEIEIGRGDVQAGFDAYVRRALGKAAVGPTVQLLARTRKRRDARPPLLVVDHVAPPVAQALVELKQPFVDAAGNAYFEGPDHFVRVEGRKPTLPKRRGVDGRAYTKAGLKVQFALLCDPKRANETHRRIAEAAGVALGVVPAVLEDLRVEGKLAVAGRRRRLVEPRRILDEWAVAYARTLRPKTLLFRYAAKSIRDWRAWRPDPREATWGGEPAAELLVGGLEPGVLTLYAERAPAKLLVAKDLRLAEDGEHAAKVEIRKPFWGRDCATREARQDVVPAPLVYADLLATGDARCMETATRVAEKVLARRFED